jgi:tRNASer (uridine44-2'-O)-methyltransferase
MVRPPLVVTPLHQGAVPSLESTDKGPWLPVARCSFPFGLDVFFLALEDIIRHPERNSSSILRADILEDDTSPEDPPIKFDGFEPASRIIRRRLMPKRPFDGPLSQDCVFFKQSTDSSKCTGGIVAMLPEQVAQLPFYHPKVAGIAFSLWLQDQGGGVGADSVHSLRIDYFPHGGFPFPERISSDEPTLPTSSRLYRTALALLDSVHQHGHGLSVGYEKRVHHDLIVPRETYQDLYLEMKARWSWVIDKWVENTDSSKHVFEVSM